MRFTLPLDTSIDLLTGGGKAMNLSVLLNEGFNVPNGFLITTSSYNHYVEHNHLQNVIINALKIGDDIESLETASEQIRAAFRKGVIPKDLVSEILGAFTRLNSEKVAVRSSATAEDLPDMSFAGQQDTFLNVDEVDLIKSVIECWSSLWTPRAIGYRNRNQIDHEKVALAVVVQCMIPSETSGVMFTVNPLTGNHTETVIDATFGLGEALVSGQVEPDNYVVYTDSGNLKKIHLGSKGGESSRALTKEQLTELTRVGLSIHSLYETPQDIEWAYSKGILYVLQSRPVTGIYPILENVPIKPLTFYGSLNHVQGVLSPFTPMGSDILRYLIISHGRRVGAKLEMNQTSFLVPAGGRLFTNITGLVQNQKLHSLVENILGSIEPEMGSIFQEMKRDPRLQNTNRLPTPLTLFKIARVMIPLGSRVIVSVLIPESSREKLNQTIDSCLEEWSTLQQGATSPQDHIDIIYRIFEEIPPIIFTKVLPSVVAGIGSFMQVKMHADSLDMSFDGLNIARGLPHNVTSKMDLDLWDRVKQVKQDQESSQALRRPIHELVESYKLHGLPQTLTIELDEFFKMYGMRGTGEIDIGALRWVDDPSHILQTMQSYLDITDPEKEPDVVFKKGYLSGEESRLRIIEAVRRKKGRLRGKIIEVLCKSQKNLASLRETPKFFIVRTLAIIRDSLIVIGDYLKSIGVIESTSDVFYIKLNELCDVIEAEKPIHELVVERKAVYLLEMQRLRVPRVITSEGDTYYSPKQSDDSGISGSPVSPGTVEGLVRVLLTPTSDKLNPGEILVCQATDPSWTPLFLAAGGLVMEVGGLMTHGSVVAREYGIPAVVGVRDATTRLKTGQRIRVDGEFGVITLLTKEDP